MPESLQPFLSEHLHRHNAQLAEIDRGLFWKEGIAASFKDEAVSHQQRLFAEPVDVRCADRVMRIFVVRRWSQAERQAAFPFGVVVNPEITSGVVRGAKNAASGD